MEISNKICPLCSGPKEYRSKNCLSCRKKEPEEKVCYGCKLKQSIENFSLRDNEENKKEDRKIKRRSKCKECENERKRKINWKRYGLNLEEIEKIILEHNGQCDICGEREINNRKLSIDHCHSTLKFRGVLCSKCNLALGLFKDNPENLIKANLYLINFLNS